MVRPLVGPFCVAAILIVAPAVGAAQAPTAQIDRVLYTRSNTSSVISCVGPNGKIPLCRRQMLLFVGGRPKMGSLLPIAEWSEPQK